MARRESRVCIELGVQGPKLSTLNRFVANWNRLYPCGLKENYLTFNRVESEFDPESTPSSKPYELFRIESSRLVPEPIHFHPDFTFNVRKALRVDSSTSELIPKRSVRGVKRTRCSAYGNNGPSGVVSVCGAFVSTWDIG
ncbi:hypothetical protein PIB30_076128 [Stylosanthes scabra]|uniref:Uncharacterized protein n=1 Tax=Stylosanthes scabra TaxID=79078 RepID=A0ABU6WRE0_9FABA|nr:hypothetical protein [Stylosanthes scabra]